MDRINEFLRRVAYYRKGDRSLRYGLSISLLILAFYFQTYFYKIAGIEIPYLFFTSIVIFCAWYGGFGPGVFTTFFATIITMYYITKFPHQEILSKENLIRSTLFFLEGLFISVLSEIQKQADMQKNEFIGYASHELKNPLHVVNAYLSLLYNLANSENNTKFLTYTKKIRMYVQTIIHQVNDLLDISTMESGKFSYNYTWFSIQSLIKEIVINQRLIMDTHTIFISGSSKKYLYGDRYRIGQVLINILTNAVKYSPQSDHIDLKIRDVKDGSIISIRDYGVGIVDANSKNLFQRSFRSISAKKSTIRGTGLGLYIADQIVKAHKGKIWYTSKVKRGTIFYVMFPTQKSQTFSPFRD